MKSALLCLLVFASVINAQWTRLPGPEGGSVLALAGTGDTLFAGTNGSGVYRSFNGGQQWTLANNGITKFDIEALAVSGNTVYAGGYNFDGGFFVSTDLGTTWTDRSATFNSKYVKCILKTDSALFVGTYGYGLFRSTNDGASWKKIDSGLTTNVVSVMLRDNNTLYAGTSAGVFVSTDQGISWAQRSTGITTAAVQALTMKDGMIFAGTTNGIFMTTNAGVSWTSKSNGLVYSVVYALGVSGGKILAATNASVCFSNNNGDNWNNPVTKNGMSGYTVTPALLVTPAKVYAATMYNVYMSDNNGINWANRTTGIAAAASYGMWAGPSFLLASYGNYGIRRSFDWGRSWGNSDSTLFMQVRSYSAGPVNLHAATNTGNLLHSSDQGAKWITDSLPSGVTLYATGWARIGSTMFVSDNGKGVFRSTNDGVSWTAAYSDNSLPKSVWSMTAVDTVLFCGTTTGIYKSVTGGTTWTPANGGNTTMTNGVINALTSVDGVLYAGAMEQGIFISTNRGASWRPFGTPLITNVGSFASYRSKLFALTAKEGVIVLKDTVWTPFNTGLLGKSNGMLQFAGDTMYLSTIGSGVWKRPYAEILTGVLSNSVRIPASCALDQNYPNPFNPSTTIRFRTAERSAVRLDVYNTVGQLVRTLVNGMFEAGEYRVTMDAHGLSSGMYFYRLRSGDAVMTRSMILMK